MLVEAMRYTYDAWKFGYGEAFEKLLKTACTAASNFLAIGYAIPGHWIENTVSFQVKMHQYHTE